LGGNGNRSAFGKEKEVIDGKEDPQSGRETECDEREEVRGNC